MTPTATANTQRADLLEQLRQEEDRHREAVIAWRAAADPIRQRIRDNLAKYEATGLVSYAKAANVARLDLDLLEKEPVEGYRIGILRGRLHRLDNP